MARNTVQQAIIEHALHELGNHPTAEEVFQFVSEEHPSIGKATVYRTLNKLVENGKATKVPMTTGADRFDHTIAPHYHVQCTQCGSIEDAMITLSEDVIAEATEASTYRVNNFSLQFWGICPNCMKMSM